MKCFYKILLSSLLFLSLNSYADNVRIVTDAQSGELFTSDFRIEQAQAKLTCHFTRNKTGGLMVRTRYLSTNLTDVNESNAQIKIKKGSLTEWLPGFTLERCAYVVIVIGKDSSEKSYMGDIVLAGKLTGKMTDAEIQEIQDRDSINKVLKDRLGHLYLFIGQDYRGRTRIISK